MRRIALAVLALAFSTACSPKHLVIGAAANALGGEGSGWGTDDDPELVGDAVPFVLKTTESLLKAEPQNTKLLFAACSGFTQYGYAFVDQRAQMDPYLRPEQVTAAHQRAMKLIARGHGYCLRGMDSRHEHWSETFQKDPEAALKQLDDKDDVPFLYWMAASLALQISGQKDNPALLADLPRVGQLAEKALALNGDWDRGSVHELLEAYYASLPAASGGSVEKAKAHRDAALQLSQNKKLGPLVTWAEDVAVAQQDKAEFMRLIDQVLAFDVDSAPDDRLANVLAQRRAAWLKAHVDDLFA